MGLLNPSLKGVARPGDSGGWLDDDFVYESQLHARTNKSIRKIHGR